MNTLINGLAIELSGALIPCALVKEGTRYYGAARLPLRVDCRQTCVLVGTAIDGPCVALVDVHQPRAALVWIPDTVQRRMETLNAAYRVSGWPALESRFGPFACDALSLALDADWRGQPRMIVEEFLDKAEQRFTDIFGAMEIMNAIKTKTYSKEGVACRFLGVHPFSLALVFVQGCEGIRYALRSSVTDYASDDADASCISSWTAGGSMRCMRVDTLKNGDYCVTAGDTMPDGTYLLLYKKLFFTRQAAVQHVQHWHDGMVDMKCWTLETVAGVK
jgi:hypothetical protein